MGQAVVWIEKEKNSRRPKEEVDLEKQVPRSGKERLLKRKKEWLAMSNMAEMVSKIRSKQCWLGLEIWKPWRPG